MKDSLKLRAWIADAPMELKKESKMFYQETQYLSTFLKNIYDCYGVSHPSYLPFNLEERLMLYTGYDDKNGIGIYRKDIVKCYSKMTKSTILGEIILNDCAYQISNVKQISLSLFSQSEITIVGNTLENPEICKDKNYDTFYYDKKQK